MRGNYDGLDAWFEAIIKRLEEANDPNGEVAGLKRAREEILRCERGDYDDRPVFV